MSEPLKEDPAGLMNQGHEKGIVGQDIAIAGLTLVLILGLIIFFYRTQTQLLELIQSFTPADDDPQDLMDLAAMRYRAAGTLLLANTSRKNLGLLIGSVITMMGCWIVLIGVRESPLEAEAESEVMKFKLLTGSPGIVIALIGAVVIIATLRDRNELQVHDGVVLNFTQGQAALDSSAEANGQASSFRSDLTRGIAEARRALEKEADE